MLAKLAAAPGPPTPTRRRFAAALAPKPSATHDAFLAAMLALFTSGELGSHNGLERVGQELTWLTAAAARSPLYGALLDA